MRDWLDDPENRKAYERFLRECREAETVAERARRAAGESGTGARKRRSRAGSTDSRKQPARRPGGREPVRKRRPRTPSLPGRIIKILAALALLLALAVLLRSCMRSIGMQGGPGSMGEETSQTAEEAGDRWYGCPDIDVQLLTPNPYSRPQTELVRVNGIVVHYTANPGSSAQNNHDYFENIGKSGENSVSSHFIIGLDGEIIQCVPSSEVAYASNHRNSDTLSIECCHPDESGKFTQETYDALVQLTAWLCRDHGLDASDVIRHYDVTGKNCPKYFVEHEDAWDHFREDVAERLEALRAGTL